MTKLSHKFVKNVPAALEEGVLYISIEYATAIHKCVCGCGKEVVTPLSPSGWSLIFNGKGVSLYPSIGNWSFPCQSHYWINDDEVEWAPKWTKEQIQEAQAEDARLARGEVKRRSLFNVLRRKWLE